MPNWFDMKLPEGWTTGGADHKSARGGGTTFVDVWLVADNTTRCLLYSDGKVHVSGSGAPPIEFPTLDEAKNFIVTMCALNAWEAP